MKKMIVMVLAAMMLLSLAACGKDDAAPQQQITMSTQPEETAAQTEAAETQTAPAGSEKEPFAFRWEGYTAVPGAPFEADKWPEAESMYQVPSCAVEGTDNVYNFGGFEITAFAENGSERIYSVYFIDPNLTTPEGLALGDGVQKVTELYGEDYAQDGAALVYTAGDTQLIVISENDVVVSIEYRWVGQADS